MQQDGHDATAAAETAEEGETQEKKDPEQAEMEDSAFAKFNVKVSLPQYGDDQYSSNLANEDWTKEETDYLLTLVKDYDLRWPIIWDRYEFVPQAASNEESQDDTAVVPASRARSVEDLKARYYEVAAKMMAVQKPAQYMTRPEFELYEMMMHFNPAQEKARKDFALNSMSRSRDEAREEESLLLEIKRILARTERFNEERRELYRRLDYPHTDQDISAYKSSAGLQNLLQNLMNVDKSNKKRRSLGGAADGISPAGVASAGPNGHPPSGVSEGHNRRESIAASVSGHRDSLGGAATPITPSESMTPVGAGNKKKGAAQIERRKLSEQEEQVYGISHHDRLGSGPTFRYEKINKLYSHKSGQQQLRITNALGELDVPPRLVMPTAAVTAQFEVLWSAVTALVDLRKVSDKLDAEIKLEEAKKAERDKARGIVPTADAAEKTSDAAAPPATDKLDAPAAADAPAEDKADGAVDTAEAAPDKPAVPTPVIHIKEEDGDAAAQDGQGDKEKRQEKDKTPRPSSSGTAAHKRSASVLSGTSDKSAKRMKK
jgi:DNA methyltransferase 1-associated protein 1